MNDFVGRDHHGRNDRTSVLGEDDRGPVESSGYDCDHDRAFREILRRLERGLAQLDVEAVALLGDAYRVYPSLRQCRDLGSLSRNYWGLAEVLRDRDLFRPASDPAHAAFRCELEPPHVHAP